MKCAYAYIFPLTGIMKAFGVCGPVLLYSAIWIIIYLLILPLQIDTFTSSRLQLLDFKYCTQQNWPQILLNKEVTFSEIMPIRDFSRVH